MRYGPGVRCLDTPITSISEWEHWKHSVIYQLRLEPDFKPFLVENFVFVAKTRLAPNRQLTATTGENALSREERCSTVDFMLSQIAQYCPKIPHNDIARECASLAEVWQLIRLHNNIESSGALLNEVWKITRLPHETPQQLYSRVKQAYDDSLMRANTIKYKDAVLPADEEMSPTLHCTVILHWLQILHPKLRDVVTRQFSTQLERVLMLLYGQKSADQ